MATRVSIHVGMDRDHVIHTHHAIPFNPKILPGLTWKSNGAYLLEAEDGG